jgi:hypothetical protein
VFDKFGPIERVDRQKNSAIVRFSEAEDASNALNGLKSHEWEIRKGPLLYKWKKEKSVKSDGKQAVPPLEKLHPELDYAIEGIKAAVVELDAELKAGKKMYILLSLKFTIFFSTEVRKEVRVSRQRARVQTPERSDSAALKYPNTKEPYGTTSI